MIRGNLNDLNTFSHNRRTSQFPRGSSSAGGTSSALSHSIRQLEGRLGARTLASNDPQRFAHGLRQSPPGTLATWDGADLGCTGGIKGSAIVLLDACGSMPNRGPYPQ